MSLEVIKQLKGTVEELKKELEETKTEAEAIRDEMKEALAERKATFEEKEVVSPDKVEKAKKQLKGLYVQSKILERPMDSLKGFKDAASVIEKAVTPADLSSWAAEEFSNEVLEGLELELTVANMFKTIQMPDNRQTLSIPARTGNLSAYLIAPAASAVESAITGGKVSFTVQKLMAYSAIADEADAEIVAATTDLTIAELKRSLARGIEDSIINGDTAYAVANDPKKLYDGLRKYGNANAVDNGGGNITLDNINAARKKMGIYGIQPSELALIVNPNVYYQLFGISEFLTIDKIGSKATLVTGQVGSIFGYPVIVTEYIANNLGTDGSDNNGDAGDVTSEALLVNKNYFYKCQRGGVMLEKQRQAKTGTNDLVSSLSVDFKNVAVAGTPVAALTNIAGS